MFLLRSVLVAAVAVGAMVLTGCGSHRIEVTAGPLKSQAELEAMLGGVGITPVKPWQSQPGSLSFGLNGPGKCTATLVHYGKLYDEDGKELNRSATRPEYQFQVFNASGTSILKLPAGWSMDRLRSEATTRNCFDASAPVLTTTTSR